MRGVPTALLNASLTPRSGETLKTGLPLAASSLEHSPATAHLSIVNPLSDRGAMGPFATHPPMEALIARLLSMR